MNRIVRAGFLPLLLLALTVSTAAGEFYAGAGCASRSHSGSVYDRVLDRENEGAGCGDPHTRADRREK